MVAAQEVHYRIAQRGQGLVNQLLLWAYTCVFLNRHMSGAEQDAEQVN